MDQLASLSNSEPLFFGIIAGFYFLYATFQVWTSNENNKIVSTIINLIVSILLYFFLYKFLADRSLEIKNVCSTTKGIKPKLFTFIKYGAFLVDILIIAVGIKRASANLRERIKNLINMVKAFVLFTLVIFFITFSIDPLIDKVEGNDTDGFLELNC